VLDRDTRVFGIGLSRTGTLSLAAALTELGIEARHYPNDPLTQQELRAGRYALSVLDEVQALTDIPVSPFYPQLDRAFPGSRFILTTRETESWLASVENHFRMYVEHRRDAFDDFVLACAYGCLEFSAERFRDVKELHEDNVRRYFADRPGDLLVLDVAEAGTWEPLCNFLGVPVPDEPYPHTNPALQRPAFKPTRRARLRARLRRRLASIRER
jgi:Sulfotransferase domain